jgi:solute carrier family 32 (vesicular inhibitory amino acid transporter)
VQSPNLSFLGTPTLSRLSNSFLNSSFRAKTPEVISNLVKPLLRPTSDEQEHQQQQHEDARKSSQYILPSSRKPSLDQIPEDRKPGVIGHELPPYQKCSYTQGVMNGKHQTTLLYNFLKYVLSYMNLDRNEKVMLGLNS